MKKVFTLRRLMFCALALIAALGSLKVVVAGQTTPNLSPATRVSLLAQNVERAESVRAVKRLQETYAQYSQFGLWTEMASLFTDNAQMLYGPDSQQGRQAIEKYFLAKFGEGTHGLKPGGLHTQFAIRPLVNVSADGQSAKGRWWEFTMKGQSGVKAEWAGGIYENEYVRERNVWKISRVHYYPVFAGPYVGGWKNAEEDLKIVPYHYTPDETGIPVPDLPASAASAADAKINAATVLAGLEQRISVMNDEDKVRNLQNAYGYYMDQKMWDDVTDLFTSDGALSIANVGVYDGPKSIRRALERSGPAGLQRGQLNEHLQLDAAIAIDASGVEARSRGIEFGLIGEADKGTQFFTLTIFENRYVKENDIWKIREMRMFPLMKTEYTQGWAKSQVVDPAPDKAYAPDRAALASDVMAAGAIPEFFIANPATGKAVSLPSGAKVVGRERLLPAPAVRRAAAPSGDLDARIKDAERRLLKSKAWDAAENLESAYGHYLDDLNYGPLGQLFATAGQKEVPNVGFYQSRERIMQRDAGAAPPGSRPRATIPIHWLMQHVVMVADDGRSASVRSRLFQTGTNARGGSGFSGGMYHNQIVLENGIWRLWSVNIDEFYYQYQYDTGWSAVNNAAPAAAGAGRGQAAPGAGRGQGAPGAARGQAAPGGGGQAAAGGQAPAGGQAAAGGGRGQAAAGGARGGGALTGANYPADITLDKLTERERGFRGGPGDVVSWPNIAPMWFHYKNPVSGRTPPRYWPDCETCVQFPETSMKSHGYTLPPA